MKIEISVAEQNELISLMEKSKSSSLAKFLNRLYKVKEKRTKRYDDKVDFELGDVVKVVKYASHNNSQVTPYIVVSILKDSKGRIYYGVYGPVDVNENFEIYLQNMGNRCGDEYCWEYRGHCLEKIDTVPKSTLDKMKGLFPNDIKKSKFISHI